MCTDGEKSHGRTPLRRSPWQNLRHRSSPFPSGGVEKSQSRFVLIRYAVHEKEEPYGLRLDLDKKAILDDVGDAATATAVKARAQDIWKIVVDMRSPRR